MTPDAVDRCSMWQLQAAAEGYRKAHQSEAERAKELSPDEVDALSEILDD